ETLRRCPPQDAPQLYMQMLAYAADLPELRRLLHGLARGRPALEIVYMEHTPPAEALKAINNVLQTDPVLALYDDAQKNAFFRAWAADGGADDLLRRLPANPAWQPFVWREAAAALAARGDFEQACGWAFRHLPSPALPEKPSADAAKLRRRLASRPDDYAAAYGLAVLLSEQKDPAGAQAVLQSITAQPGCPSYFHFLEADIEFHAGDFAAAWAALQKYPPFTSG
ncbi:MAG TPA: hypothetical protein VG733_08655, partial [Chthoniobacteraceae bacterium]|nr:hypothetical protein [Chthoniobacteraceae bacterium]